MSEKKGLIKTKKQMFIVIGAFALILLLGTASYAFFNYTRTGGENRVGIGRIYFNTDQGNDTLTLTNIFPMTSSQATTANLDSVSVHIQGDTTYEDGEEFEIILVNVTNTVNGKTIPINYTATYVASENKGIGTSSDSYFTSRGSSSNVYQFTSTGEVSEGKQVLVGFIPKNGEVDGTLTIKAYIDSSKVVISDTLAGGAVEVTGYNNGYPQPAGAVVLTTAEWNALEGAGTIKFSVRGIANEGTWVPEPPVQYAQGVKCQRVTSTAKLHKETCTNSSHCKADGYALNADITYGNTSVTSGELHTGDAFDCDVNGDGIVNVDTNGNSTERFYYVSRYYDTNANPPAFDNTTATLIYYSDTYNGVASTNGAAYHSSDNWHGPVTAATHLPTTTQWSNIQLKTTSRTILACGTGNFSDTQVLTTNNGSNTIDNPFNYMGKAARLLTVQELEQSGCATLSGETSLTDIGSLAACNFLFEGTQYAVFIGKSIRAIWLETPFMYTPDYALYMDADSRRVKYYFVNNDTNYGVRPTTDVAISDIDY